MTTRALYPPAPSVDRRSLPPGPKELPLVGRSFRYVFDPIGIMRETAAYGDLATMSVKPALVYLLNHPDLVREVFVNNHQKVGRGRNTEALQYLLGEGLVTSDGPLHLRQRRLMQPQFHRRRIEGYAEIMADYARRHQQGWRDGARLDLMAELGDLTLHIVVKTLFDLELPDAVRRIGAAFEVGNDYVTARGNQPRRLGALLHRLPAPFTRRFKRNLSFLDETVYGLIEQRRQSGVDGSDLLSMLLQIRDEDAASPDEAVMTDAQLRDEVITLFVAGHETTAVALAWTWHLLSVHPDIQARFHAELDEALAGRPPALDDLPNLPFTDRIVTEAMRLYPPIWTTGRMAFQPFELAGYHIPAGAVLAAPQLVIQRDARWFEAPLEFRPDRWTPEFRESLPRFAYFPFGGGPRVCIGEGFAGMETRLLLATIGQRWRMYPDRRHKIRLQPLVSLRPKGGLPVYLERRASPE